MLDIDSFKKINDTFGHVAGDEALKLLAGVLRGRRTGSGFAARYGGDEFCLVSVVALFPRGHRGRPAGRPGPGPKAR